MCRSESVDKLRRKNSEKLGNFRRALAANWNKVCIRWNNLSTRCRFAWFIGAVLGTAGLVWLIAWRSNDTLADAGWVLKHTMSTCAALLGAVAGWIQARKAGGKANITEKWRRSTC